MSADWAEVCSALLRLAFQISHWSHHTHHCRHHHHCLASSPPRPVTCSSSLVLSHPGPASSPHLPSLGASPSDRIRPRTRRYQKGICKTLFFFASESVGLHQAPLQLAKDRRVGIDNALAYPSAIHCCLVLPETTTLRRCLDLFASSLAYPGLQCVGLSQLPHHHHSHTVLHLAPQIEAPCVSLPIYSLQLPFRTVELPLLTRRSSAQWPNYAEPVFTWSDLTPLYAIWAACRS